ncbi:MAG: hypothetical protein U1F54_01985 [Burkholderiales bacterium]
MSAPSSIVELCNSEEILRPRGARRHAVACALWVSAVAALLAVPPALAAGTGTGYCSVDGQKFDVKHVYAHQRTRTTNIAGKDVKETAVTIWLTDQPLDTAALDKETDDHFRAVMRQMGQSLVKGTPRVRFIRIELTPAGKAVNFDCSPKGEGTVGTSDAGRFEAKTVNPTRVAGRFTTGGAATVSSTRLDVDVTFDAPVAAER